MNEKSGTLYLRLLNKSGILYLDASLDGERYTNGVRRLLGENALTTVKSQREHLRKALISLLEASDEEDVENSFSILQQRGYSLFKILVHREKALSELIQDNPKTGKFNRIVYQTNDVFLPIGLIHSDAVSQSSGYDSFWGVKYHVVTQYLDEDVWGDDGEVRLHEPRVLFVGDMKVPGVREEESFLLELQKKKKISLNSICNNGSVNSKKVMEEWIRDGGVDLVQFSCHSNGKYCTPDQPTTELHLSNPKKGNVFSYEVLDHYEDQGRLPEAPPAVFLNACKTGVSEGAQTDLVTSLLKNRTVNDRLFRFAECVVGTETVVKGSVSFKFNVELYRSYMKLLSVKSALVDARRNMANRDDPASLLYMLYH